ncbi:BREX-2 system adenine-specific DNA-methyltransferase PglX [Gimesia chilikensis]|uniref:BREX-2 system adenine-specific DNA-methyltransferase PglX n=1 Tax=Gimesia chilikensis TaxID=2605989 RepID=UPI001F550DAC|nr:BREX-2 system adenine-specific DNA-methyltransferase PglX [Gimesia chilikensis]
MINRSALLSDLQKLLKRLEADLLERSDSPDVPAVGETLRTEYEQARTAERTAQNYEDWRSDAITQAAAAWVLSAVFVRFLEDNQLIEPPRFSGPGDQLQRARDERELYFRAHPTETDREYVLAVFDELATLPGTREVFGDHNPLRELPQWLSGDAAGELLAFFQKIDANAGGLVHDFTDADWDTRFLGDLYQDLSEAARKKYALLQTPEFVEEFILDRTLEPALDEFGLDAPPVTDAQGTAVTPAGFRMIDPACGSGHFLLGTFPRLLDRWYRKEPGGKVRDLVQKTLDSIHGVDVNPYAIAIARFRLLLKAMQACDIHQLKNAPAFTLHLACGDSLLHSPLRGGQQVFDFELTSDDAECEHAYQSEDLPALKQTLRSGIYHAVVANPPYITPKDRQLNQRYRTRFESCHSQYSLAVPFLERIFRLAVTGGFTGQITANSFMKREFGKKLMGECISKADRLQESLNHTSWDSFNQIQKLAAKFKTAVTKILDDLQQALVSDEHVHELGPALQACQSQASRLISDALENLKPDPAPPAATPDPELPPPATTPGVKVIEQDVRQGLTLPEAEETLTKIKSRLQSGQSVQIYVSWVIEEGGTQA